MMDLEELNIAREEKEKLMDDLWTDGGAGGGKVGSSFSQFKK